MRRLVGATLVVVAAGFVGTARGADEPNPTGTWKWTIDRGGQSMEVTLKLKLDGDKLTGAMVGRNGQETPISDGSYKNGEISFKVVRERQGQKTTTAFHGKLKGDTLTGKTETERDGQTQSRQWTATRAKQ
jgi:hypothetical protein